MIETRVPEAPSKGMLPMTSFQQLHGHPTKPLQGVPHPRTSDCQSKCQKHRGLSRVNLFPYIVPMARNVDRLFMGHAFMKASMEDLSLTLLILRVVQILHSCITLISTCSFLGLPLPSQLSFFIMSRLTELRLHLVNNFIGKHPQGLFLKKGALTFLGLGHIGDPLSAYRASHQSCCRVTLAHLRECSVMSGKE